MTPKNSAMSRNDGLLLIDKPAGPTSHDIVMAVRRRLNLRRVGHAGTLDPFATGLLILLLGRATRLVQYVAGGPKLYEGTILLGVRTDTDDITGKTLSKCERDLPSSEQLLEAAGSFTGRGPQIPPSYSAKKVGGVRAYRQARKGLSPALRPVQVTVHTLEILEYAPPRARFRASVSPGAYLRALARDFGDQMGVGGCLESLRRLSSGPFHLGEAISPEATGREMARRILSLSEIPLGLPCVIIPWEDSRRLAQGQAIAPPSECGQIGEGVLRLEDPDGELLGTGRLVYDASSGRRIQPIVVFPRESPIPAS